MAVARPALPAAGCSHCRVLVLNLFTACAPRPAPIHRPSPSSLSSNRARIAAATAPLRPFSSLPGRSGARAPSSEEQESQGNAADAAPTPTPAPGGLQPAAVPWYLQVEPPTHTAPLVPPPLPETPPDAPALIRPLLEYASDEMGLDDLSVLDLRELDPPPALGPNLFMLFGTARSERHLTVSAGRLVRWLRAKHRVHADADGLLGPNERKTKLRRKARRAKLLGTMGTDDADDGIRTGWICVNLGTIDRGGAESAVLADDGRVSGFGVSQTGSTIVFQVMTEARRAEMGLEALWTQALARSLSPSNSNSNSDSKSVGRGRDSTPRVETGDESDHVANAILSNAHRPAGVLGGRKGQSVRASPLNQARFYFTGPAAKNPLLMSSAAELTHVLTYNGYEKRRLVDLLRVQLDSMDAQTAQAALGGNTGVSKATPFLELAELVMEALPPTRTWGLRLAIQHKVSVSGDTNVPRPLHNIQLLIEELCVYGIKATRDQYLQLLFCIFHAYERQTNLVVNLALDVIKIMYQRGELIMANDVIVTIIEGASKPNFRRRWDRELMERLERLFYLPNAPCLDEQLLMRLTTAYAHAGYWAKLWNAWGIPARHLRSRSADLYVHVIDLATTSGSAAVCTHALRRCVPEAFNEDPPTITDRGVQQAISKCIIIADPGAQRDSRIPEDSQGQMRKLAFREFVKIARLLASFQIDDHQYIDPTKSFPVEPHVDSGPEPRLP